MYYLQSRYYDPKIGRFLNADVYTSTGQGILGNNMFAYCGNNPICFSDTYGTFPWFILGAAALGGAMGVFGALISGVGVDEVIKSGLDGAAVGALLAVYPELAIIVSSYGLAEDFFECLYAGYSVEQTLAVLGLSTAAELTLPSTGDSLVDDFVDATFGNAVDMCCDVGKEVIKSSNRSHVPEQTVTRRIVSGLICGGAIGGSSRVESKAFGVDLLGLWW